MIGPLKLTKRQEGLLKRAQASKEKLLVAGGDIRTARQLSSLGLGLLRQRDFTITDNGGAILLALRDRRAETAQKESERSDPSSWGPAERHRLKKRQRQSPLERLHAAGEVDDDMVRIAQQLVRGFQYSVQGTGCRTSRFEERIDASTGWNETVTDYDLRLAARYDLFRSVTKRLEIEPSLIIDILVYETALGVAARARNMSRARAKVMLLNLLAEMVQLIVRGTPRQRETSRLHPFQSASPALPAG